jgi:hypothetical protein
MKPSEGAAGFEKALPQRASRAAPCIPMARFQRTVCCLLPCMPPALAVSGTRRKGRKILVEHVLHTRFFSFQRTCVRNACPASPQQTPRPTVPSSMAQQGLSRRALSRRAQPLRQYPCGAHGARSAKTARTGHLSASKRASERAFSSSSAMPSLRAKRVKLL